MNETEMNEQKRTAKLKAMEDSELTEMNLDNVSGGAKASACWVCDKIHSPHCKNIPPSKPLE